VGVLDADIYGPNVPLLLGATEKPESVEGRFLRPVVCHGIQSMSIGYLIDDDNTALVWRGPMVTKAHSAHKYPHPTPPHASPALTRPKPDSQL